MLGLAKRYPSISVTRVQTLGRRSIIRFGSIIDLLHRLPDMYARAVGLNVPGLKREQLLRAHTREEQQPYAVARLAVRQVLEQLSDFFRFGVKYVEELYAQQPVKNAPGAWK